jgi:hypothetical protein
MKKKASSLFAVPILVLLATGVLVLLMLPARLPPAFAHTEVQKGDVKIEAGWGTEPPLQGQLNTIVVSVTRGGEPVTNALEGINVAIKKGGDSKALDFRPGEQAGTYVADIIPTQTGQYSVGISGTVAGQKFDDDIVIEDAADTKSISFPEGGNAGQGIPQGFIEQMRSVITDLTVKGDGAQGAAKQAGDAAQSAAKTAGDIKASAESAYLVGMVGIGVGVAGIALAAVALSRRAATAG